MQKKEKFRIALWEKMSEESDKDDQLTDPTTSDEDELDNTFMKFVNEDLHHRALFTDTTCDQSLPRTTQILLEYQLGRWVPRLREPRDLYGVSSSGPLSQTRWPCHCEVVEEKILHIDYAPSYPEPLYVSTGDELEPHCLDSTQGTVVYVGNDAYKGRCFLYSRIGGIRSLQKHSEILPVEDYDNTLIFEARFESGNLQKVVKVTDHEYQLTVRPDLFTSRHTQWYYFQVTNTQAGIPYRFTIVNFTKPYSLYNKGMRPLFYSEKEAKMNNIGWRRTGDQIKYYRNNIGQEGRPSFSLTWTFQFPHDKDRCYFAHCYPYTYANLQDYLSRIANDPKRSQYCKIRVLCHTLARNMVYVLTITTPLKSTELRKRKVVILTARVHPGETNSSWIMKGFLDYILGDSSDAQLLRDTFIFKVIPMLNPDGVIVGNYRCSLAGQDLNRCYTSIQKDSYPSVWYTRNMIRRLMEDREILLYCDLHGHSRRGNIFMYGCQNNYEHKELCLEQRVFPFMLSKNCPNKFSFSACKFVVRKSKEGTGRVVMWKMGIHNSFTMEATFCGSTLGNRRGTHFNTKDLESMGYHFCDSLLDYCDPDQTKYFQCMKELEELQMQHSGITSPEKMHYVLDASFIDAALDLDSSSDESDISETSETFLKGTSQNKVGESEVIPPNQESERKHAKNNRMKILDLTGKQMSIFSPFGEGPFFKKLQNQKVASRGDAPQRPKEITSKAKVKLPGPVSPWLLKNYLSSYRLTLNNDHSKNISEPVGPGEQKIQKMCLPKKLSTNGNNFKTTSQQCPSGKSSSWTEKIVTSKEDLQCKLKNNYREPTTSQRKKSNMNQTENTKRIFIKNKSFQTQEIFEFLFPVVESAQGTQSPQMKQLNDPQSNIEIQYQNIGNHKMCPLTMEAGSKPRKITATL
ncbi:cytosolic carboxypeptidase 3 isoform X1 [Sarcophilus harrisii]|uniref:cytosolic carboxypeptidase 3 isoform X1 n=1 Tax=Sarcophilus harrisii TaxID=9305 RepID=UPI000227018D|nr:cytosolic carboxypeptidase 3 isoform X1 [Sarcophilus harrisii]